MHVCALNVALWYIGDLWDWFIRESDWRNLFWHQFRWHQRSPYACLIYTKPCLLKYWNAPHDLLLSVVRFITDRIPQGYRSRKHFVNTRNAHNIEPLLHSAGGHQGSHKAHQAGNHLLIRAKQKYPLTFTKKWSYYNLSNELIRCDMWHRYAECRYLAI